MWLHRFMSTDRIIRSSFTRFPIITTILTTSLSTIRLLPATIDTHIHVTNASAFTIKSSIRVYHLHRFGIAAVQPIRTAGLDQRPGRIQSNNALDSKVQIVGQHAAQMSAKRMTNTCRSLHRHSGAAQKRKVLGETASDRFQIVHGRHVARRRTQRAPVQVEHVVVAVIDVGWWRKRLERIYKQY